MTLGLRIKEAREALGWDLPRLAKESGIPYPTLAGIEQGNQRTSTKTPQLAQVLGVSAVWLATGTGPRIQGAREMNVKQQVGEVQPAYQIQTMDPAILSRALFWLDFEERARGLYQPLRRAERLMALYQQILADGGEELSPAHQDEIIEAARRRGVVEHGRGAKASGGN